jgi:methyltransferase
MVSLWGFTVLLGLLALQRLFELSRSRHNEIWMKKHGGYECFPEHYRVMVLLHISWFVAMLAEVWFYKTIPPQWLIRVGIAGMVSGQILRYLAMRTLAERWSTRIYVLPNVPLIKNGIYGFIRHPNYWGVILEIACVPLILGAYYTSILFSLANLLLLRHRIRLEEIALEQKTVIS